ncbi:MULTISPECIES: GIY-YIG nuclease family protein [Thermoactinomyces]|jgi:putative endonuclease|uniref:GIY-YIG nuclease family protein n=1 Tax=Thermoactinomyces daqus TaxID=1329516 RepID=A0A7W1X9D3_9BACL|nr:MULTISPECIES: GIY-YIG nuclease family protein [Thermoactinomyces]MBA4542466.1 GIY-YIG nuclease family protein [Thermoactinomyces daqus]MBH8598745.1 GIY-YIG nuclease family protein [Thermoactinomyces sp. CICC 10523]MBH8604730.1 GIY-YIG nuclease family protein [Thermoactinomyces sp. CICC 10522]MBH8607444.1 GIY-YIG nuclease family protein [Thermoactinomyces sp. CICC 10521]
MADSYYVYILECRDGTLYTGMTNHLERRLRMHRLGKGAKYTRARLPVVLRYYEAGTSKSWALKREHEIKKMSRKEKWRLIAERGTERCT